MNDKPLTDLIPCSRARTLDGLFRERTRRSPDAVAYRYFDRETAAWLDLTWSDMAEQVARWQRALAREGLQAGDRVALTLRNCPEWVMFDQAALALGLVVVPLYPDDRPDNVRFILDDAQVRLLLVQDANHWRRLAPAMEGAECLQRVVLANDEAGPEGRVRALAAWLEAGVGTACPTPPTDPHRLASIVYTSGTTGRSKGVMLSHHNMLWVAEASLKRLDVYPDDLFLSFLPLSHTLERTGGYYLPVMAGATVAYARSVPQLAEDLRTIRPTVLIAVPRIFERVYDRITQQAAAKSALSRGLFHAACRVGWKRFEARGRFTAGALIWPLLRILVARRITAALGGRLRAAVSGGAALPLPVAKLFIGLGVPVLQGYGLTETSPVIAVNGLEDNDPASVGAPLDGIEVRIGADRELQVRGPGVMQGYWNNPAATTVVLDADGWLHTGDQVRLEQGRIHIVGRIKDVLVLSNGEKVPPGELESAIALDPVIEQVMVFGEGKPFLGAVVVLNEERWPAWAAEHRLIADALDNARLHAILLRRIGERLAGFPVYAKIRRLVLTLEPWSVDNGLLTPTLKAKRGAILERFASETEQLYVGTAGDGAAQRRKAEKVL